MFFFFSLTLIGFLSKTRGDDHFNNISVYQHPGLKQTSSFLSPNDNPQEKNLVSPAWVTCLHLALLMFTRQMKLYKPA